jgi:DNA mismatch endonuclease, patch repair protein
MRRIRGCFGSQGPAGAGAWGHLTSTRPGTTSKSFPGVRLAVFVNGCFWHSCPEHGAWWRAKLEATRVRDRHNDGALRTAGWTVLRVWEHQPVDDVVDEIRRLIQTPRGQMVEPS